MGSTKERIDKAFAHQKPDRTPLFEIFQPYHPIHWDICGRTIATDAAMVWDAKADGITWEEIVEAEAQAQFKICKYFGLDIVRLNGPTPRGYHRPVKTDKISWMLDGVKYVLNEQTKLVEIANPGESDSYSNRISEEELKMEIETWDSKKALLPNYDGPVLQRVQELAKADDIDWVYMGEIGAGTGVAFYPPFLLMWMIEEPELYLRWLNIQKETAFHMTRQMIAAGCSVIAMGGDVSCDKGPFISPKLYHEFILPVIYEHVKVIHDTGAFAVYTSDGNHWPIKDDFFFNSGIDGYKEVDKAAGMTWPRLIEEGINKQVCIIGNIDARHTLCHGTVEEVKKEVFECLKFGQQRTGGHILHASHSVHENVKIENYYALVNAYREFFGMKKLTMGYDIVNDHHKDKALHTANLAVALSRSASVFFSVDRDFSNRCLSGARKALNWAKSTTPFSHNLLNYYASIASSCIWIDSLEPDEDLKSLTEKCIKFILAQQDKQGFLSPFIKYFHDPFFYIIVLLEFIEKYSDSELSSHIMKSLKKFMEVVENLTQGSPFGQMMSYSPFGKPTNLAYCERVLN